MYAYNSFVLAVIVVIAAAVVVPMLGINIYIYREINLACIDSMPQHDNTDIVHKSAFIQMCTLNILDTRTRVGNSTGQLQDQLYYQLRCIFTL